MEIIFNEFDVRLFADEGNQDDLRILREIGEQAMRDGIVCSSVGVWEKVDAGVVVFLILDCELSVARTLLQSVGIDPQSIPTIDANIEHQTSMP